MADRGDHRSLRVGDGAGHHLCIKGGQILTRAPTATDNNHLDLPVFVQVIDTCGNFHTGPGSLYLGGSNDDLGIRAAAVQNGQDILNSRPPEGGHDADPTREERQGAFAFRGEQALGGEFGLELLQGQLLPAQPARLHAGRIDLQITSGGIQTDPALNQDLQAILGPKAEQAGIAAKHHATQLAGVVLEGEIDMPGGGSTQAGDFANDPDIAKIGLKLALDQACQVGDGQRARGAGGKGRSRHGSRSSIHSSFLLRPPWSERPSTT